MGGWVRPLPYLSLPTYPLLAKLGTKMNRCSTWSGLVYGGKPPHPPPPLGGGCVGGKTRTTFCCLTCWTKPKRCDSPLPTYPLPKIFP